MSRGLSLHIGVRRTDPVSYGNTEYTRLQASANDAWAMRSIAIHRGFRVLGLLVDEHATFRAVEKKIRHAIDTLESGDAFLMSYSGHGAHLVSPWPSERGYEEGMVLYDYIMKDDCIAVFLRRFKPGVRVMMVFDSCYSYDMHQFPPSARSLPENYDPSDDATSRIKLLDSHIAERHLKNNMAIYRRLNERFERERNRVDDIIAADIMMLSACGENETTRDGRESSDFSDFTGALLKALYGDCSRDIEPFNESYGQLPDAIHPYMQGATPRVLLLGPHAADTTYDFFRSLPFTF